MLPRDSMNFDPLLKIVNHKLIESQNRPLNSTEVLLLRGIWHDQTNAQIAQEGGYNPNYITNVVAPEMYQRLSPLVGERVTKKNCRMLLSKEGLTHYPWGKKSPVRRTKTGGIFTLNALSPRSKSTRNARNIQGSNHFMRNWQVK
jgi:hypothetical protein